MSGKVGPMIGRVKKDEEKEMCWKVKFKEGNEYRFKGMFDDVIALRYRVGGNISHIEATEVNPIVPCLFTITEVESEA